MQNYRVTKLFYQTLSFETFFFWFCFQLLRHAILQFTSISMEPKSLLSRISSNTTIPSVQSTNKFLSLSLIRSQNLVCFRTQEFLAPKIVLSYRRLDVIRSVENVKNVVTDEKNEEKYGIKKKKLAVFVSGGGSNFRSIHAACVGGSVHGDVVVLVTNKHGKISLYNYGISLLIYLVCVPKFYGLFSSMLLYALKAVML